MINLTTLKFEIGNKNFIGEEGAEELGESIKNLNNLTSLSFQIGPKNYIGTKGA